MILFLARTISRRENKKKECWSSSGRWS
ncbi:MAG: hypothetical protein ACLR6B_20770 [Blautia sp.]